MMNLKYYLRGLGIGIFVTAVIMGIALGGKKETLSNDEIKERARALGMVEESDVLADTLARQSDSAGETETDPAKTEESPAPLATKSPAPSPTETPEPEETATPEATATPTPLATKSPAPSPTGTPEPEETAAPEATSVPEATPVPAPEASPTPEPAPTEEPEEMPAGGGSVTIQVNSGDGSQTVCRKLAEVGAISSATEFDMYLYQNGYDKRLNTGTFEIPAGADYEQIAKILTSR